MEAQDRKVSFEDYIVQGDVSQKRRAANYNNYEKGVSFTTVYLERFFENLLLGTHHELKNRFCHILWKDDVSAQSDKAGFQSAIPKCKNCTLEESVVLRFLSVNPHATQTEMAKKNR